MCAVLGMMINISKTVSDNDIVLVNPLKQFAIMTPRDIVLVNSSYLDVHICLPTLLKTAK